MKIKVLSGCTRSDLPYRRTHNENASSYCSKLGYEYIEIMGFNNKKLKGREGGCTKWELISQELHDCDWLLWTDVDTMFPSTKATIESRVDTAPDKLILIEETHWHDLYGMLGPGYIFQTGVILISNRQETKDFIKLLTDRMEEEGRLMRGWSDDQDHLLYLARKDLVIPPEKREQFHLAINDPHILATHRDKLYVSRNGHIQVVNGVLNNTDKSFMDGRYLAIHFCGATLENKTQQMGIFSHIINSNEKRI